MADLQTVSAEVVRVFLAKNLTLGTAESLTGGMICAELVSVPGASRVVAGGVCSYDPRIKHEVLGVAQSVIDTVGVVSAECAKQMAAGARKLMKVDYAVSATGLAGPGGGTAGTPVGTVFIGLATDQVVTAKELHFKGSRQIIRAKAARAAIQMLYDAINE